MKRKNYLENGNGCSKVIKLWFVILAATHFFLFKKRKKKKRVGKRNWQGLQIGGGRCTYHARAFWVGCADLWSTSRTTEPQDSRGFWHYSNRFQAKIAPAFDCRGPTFQRSGVFRCPSGRSKDRSPLKSRWYDRQRPFSHGATRIAAISPAGVG